MKEYLEQGIFSVQAQENHAVRTPTDQRGEQSINRDAKTVGNRKFIQTKSVYNCREFKFLIAVRSAKNYSILFQVE